MKIRLIKPLTEDEVNLLSQINVTVESTQAGLYVNVPDTNETYAECRDSYSYLIFCCDHSNPVVKLFIKDERWEQEQITDIQAVNIEAAQAKLKNNDSKLPPNFPTYEERQQNKELLFSLPFASLRENEQLFVQENGYQREGSEQYFPLTEQGLKIVILFRSTQRDLNLAEQVSGFFSGCEKSRLDYKEKAQARMARVLSGNDKLTTGMDADEIEGYLTISKDQSVGDSFRKEDKIKYQNLCLQREQWKAEINSLELIDKANKTYSDLSSKIKRSLNAGSAYLRCFSTRTGLFSGTGYLGALFHGQAGRQETERLSDKLANIESMLPNLDNALSENNISDEQIKELLSELNKLTAEFEKALYGWLQGTENRPATSFRNSSRLSFAFDHGLISLGGIGDNILKYRDLANTQKESLRTAVLGHQIFDSRSTPALSPSQARN